MSEQIKNGGPAFPFGQTDAASGQLVNGWGSEGMSLRDYFAAKAMEGILADRENVLRFHEIGETALVSPESLAAAAAYQMADAMLAAREGGKEENQPSLAEISSDIKQANTNLLADKVLQIEHENPTRGVYIIDERTAKELVALAKELKQ